MDRGLDKYQGRRGDNLFLRSMLIDESNGAESNLASAPEFLGGRQGGHTRVNLDMPPKSCGITEDGWVIREA